jgi:Core-2/I-Branching enzyme
MSTVAAVMLTYNDPGHAQRVFRAMSPMRLIVHCDARAPAAVYDAMRQGAPSNVEFLPRQKTGWAKFACVEVELAGIRAALECRETSHVITMTGSDYPLLSTDELVLATESLGGRSRYWRTPIPHPAWVPDGGRRRFRYRNWSVGRKVIWLPVPRRLPAGVVPHASTLWKVLSRRHAEALLEVIDNRPEIKDFWHRVAVPEESFIATVLGSPELVGAMTTEVSPVDPWYVRWPGLGQPSPDVLSAGDLPELLVARNAAPDRQKWFARKLGSASSVRLIELIDEARRHDDTSRDG